MKRLGAFLIFMLIVSPGVGLELHSIKSSVADEHVAYYLAMQDIEQQFIDTYTSAANTGKINISMQKIGNTDAQYISETFCDGNFAKHDAKKTKKFLNQVLDCNTQYTHTDAYYAEITCTVNMDKVNAIITSEKSAEIGDKSEVCKTYFSNTYDRKYSTKKQTGIIYGDYTYQEFYDMGGYFDKQPDGTYIGNKYNSLREVNQAAVR